jgi:hypothetical protein
VIAFSDPERSALQELAKHRFDQCWRRGEIGDATYLRSMVFAGEDPKDAASRLRLLKQDHAEMMQRVDAEVRRMEWSRKWLAQR